MWIHPANLGSIDPQGLLSKSEGRAAVTHWHTSWVSRGDILQQGCSSHHQHHVGLTFLCIVQVQDKHWIHTNHEYYTILYSVRELTNWAKHKKTENQNLVMSFAMEDCKIKIKTISIISTIIPQINLEGKPSGGVGGPEEQDSPSLSEQQARWFLHKKHWNVKLCSC